MENRTTSTMTNFIIMAFGIYVSADISYGECFIYDQLHALLEYGIHV